MGTGPALETGLDQSLHYAPVSPTHPATAAAAGNAAATAACSSPAAAKPAAVPLPLLRGARTPGVDVSVLVTMTWPEAAPVGGSSGSSSSSGWTHPGHVAVDVQVSPVTLELSPAHLACAAAALEHATQLSQQSGSSGVAGGQANGPRVSEPSGLGPSQAMHHAHQGYGVSGAQGLGQQQWHGQQQYQPQQYQPNSTWGASSFCLEDLLAPNLEPYVVREGRT